MFCSGTKKMKKCLLYPAVKTYFKIKEIGKPPKPKTICMFFVEDEVLVKFRVQNLHSTFIEFKRKKKDNIPSEVNWKSNDPLHLNV